MINLPSMKRFLTICVGLLSVATFGQALPYTSITNIQYVSATDLANCNDTSAYLGDTVMTYGIVVTPGDRSEVASGSVQGGHRPFLFIVDTVAQGCCRRLARHGSHGSIHQCSRSAAPYSQY